MNGLFQWVAHHYPPWNSKKVPWHLNAWKTKPFLEDITLQNDLFRVHTGDSFQRILPFWIQETPALTMPCGVLSGGSAPSVPSRARNKAPPGRGKIHSLPGNYFWRWLFFLPRWDMFVFFGGYVYVPIRMMEDLGNIQYVSEVRPTTLKAWCFWGVVFLNPWDIHTSNLNWWKPSGWWKLGNWVLVFWNGNPLTGIREWCLIFILRNWKPPTQTTN